MIDPKWVTHQLAEFIHEGVIEIGGGSHGLRDAALLESALGRTGGRTGQRVKLLRDLDQQAGSVKISPAMRGDQRLRFASCRWCSTRITSIWSSRSRK